MLSSRVVTSTTISGSRPSWFPTLYKKLYIVPSWPLGRCTQSEICAFVSLSLCQPCAYHIICLSISCCFILWWTITNTKVLLFVSFNLIMMVVVMCMVMPPAQHYKSLGSRQRREACEYSVSTNRIGYSDRK